jgi:ATP-binding cassette, subfamily C (CFTR/MRP), member 1
MYFLVEKRRCSADKLRSGKSSLVLSLLRLLEPQLGSIVVDGVDISSVSHELLRSRFIAVAEEPFLFPGSIRQNLDPYGDFSDHLIIEALRDVSLWNTISEAEGLNTHIKSDFFSHGQRQLLAISRAILRRNQGKLVIFDEVSSR